MRVGLVYRPQGLLGARLHIGLMGRGSGANVFAFQAASLAVGGPLAVIGFLELAMWLGHEHLSRERLPETLDYRPKYKT